MNLDVTVEKPTVRTSLQGSLLIAMPALQDPNFHRMVTLIVSHDEDGAFGIVLGPATPLLVRQIAEPFGLDWQRGGSERVRYGGPCERARIWLIHGGDEPLQDAVVIAPGVHLGSSPSLLAELNQRSDVPMMIFSGYAGWAPGQLEREMQSKSWLPGELVPSLIFDISSDEVWEQALRLCHVSPGLLSSGQGASA